MKKLLLTCCLAAIFSSCLSIIGANHAQRTIKAQGEVVTRNVELPAFSEIDARTFLNVNIIQGSGCTIMGYENLLQYIEVKVEDGKLFVGRTTDTVNLDNDHPVEITIGVSAPLRLNYILARSMARLSVAPQITTENIEVKASSSASITLSGVSANGFSIQSSSMGNIVIADVHASELSASSSSSGKILFGEVAVNGSVEFGMSSMGYIKTQGVKANSASFQASSSGNGDFGDVKLGSKVSIGSSSMGKVNMAYLSADGLGASTSSSGSVNITDGKVVKANLDASSSGSCNLSGVKADFASCRSSSSGKCRIWAISSLKAQASSSGRVVYGGQPTDIERNTSSSGSINHDK